MPDSAARSPEALELPTLPLEPIRFAEVVRLSAATALEAASPARRRAYDGILDDLQRSLVEDSGAGVLRSLPAVIGAHMEPFGWSWNGTYVLGADGNLHLGPAHGPPVCALLERARSKDGVPAGPLGSGMCFDGILLNQTLAAPAANAWPGYLSCDAASGLRTVAGIVSPLRDAAGRPVAVWDLDATQAIEPGDVRFVDVLFATLSRCVAIDAESFGALPG